MTGYRLDGALKVVRPEDELHVGRVLHDGSGWIAETRPTGGGEIRQGGFASAEAAAAWLMAQERRPTPSDADPAAVLYPGGCVVLPVASRRDWVVEAVLRGRPADLPIAACTSYARIRLVVREGGTGGRGGTIVGLAVEETGDDGKQRLIGRVFNRDHLWKARSRPYTTTATAPAEREDKILEALVRATRPEAKTAHETLEDSGRHGAQARAERLRHVQALRRRMAQGDGPTQG